MDPKERLFDELRAAYGEGDAAHFERLRRIYSGMGIQVRIANNTPELQAIEYPKGAAICLDFSRFEAWKRERGLRD